MNLSRDLPLTTEAMFVASNLAAGLDVGMRKGMMELVESDPSVGQVVGAAPDVGRRHVDADRRAATRIKHVIAEWCSRFAVV